MSKTMSAIQACPNLPPPKPDFSFMEKPEGAIAQFFWRKRIWFESTFALSMLEPWEKILILTTFILLSAVVCTGVFKYLPTHLAFLSRRAVYYLWGQEDDPHAVWQWFGLGTGDSPAKLGSILNAAGKGRVEL